MTDQENTTIPEKNQEPETITITCEEYDRLLDRDHLLLCLEGCGVDNWSGFDDAMEMYEADEE